MSRLDSGILRWRSLTTGASGEGAVSRADHDDVAAFTASWPQHLAWLKGCTCADCDRARGANDDEQ